MDFLEFSPPEEERYARHLALPGWGLQAQKKVKAASALVVGLGGLGAISSSYLAMAGLGRIGLVDDDLVSLGNLQRQIIYRTKDIERSKAALAEQRLVEINPHSQLQAYASRLTKENAAELIEGYDLVVDGTDNMETRMVLNQVCADFEKPFIFGAVNNFDGQVGVIDASQGPCLRCLFPGPIETHAKPDGRFVAVLNTVPAIIGAIQATQALKLILGKGERLLGRLLLFNALELSFNTLEIPKKSQCEVCG